MGDRHIEDVRTGNTEHDTVNAPSWYREHPSGVECITITEHFNFNLGNAIKYLWRAGLKTDDPIRDLEKAAWYVQREIDRLRREQTPKYTHDDEFSKAMKALWSGAIMSHLTEVPYFAGSK